MKPSTPREPGPLPVAQARYLRLMGSPSRLPPIVRVAGVRLQGELVVASLQSEAGQTLELPLSRAAAAALAAAIEREAAAE